MPELHGENDRPVLIAVAIAVLCSAVNFAFYHIRELTSLRAYSCPNCGREFRSREQSKCPECACWMQSAEFAQGE